MIACNGSGYPIDFDYLTGDCFVDLDFLNGNEGIYEGYAINAMSNVDHLPYPTVGIVFGKSGVSGGYESYSQIRLDVSSANTKIAIGFIGGDLSGTASLIPTSLVCKFSNAQGQTITSRPVSAFVGTVFIGSPAEIFQAMAPSAHSLSSFNTLMAGTNVVMEVSQEPATGLLFGIDVCNNFVVRQYGTGVVGFNGFTIKIPVISP